MSGVGAGGLGFSAASTRALANSASMSRDLAKPLAMALAEHGHGIEETGWGRWSFELRNGCTVPVRAWLDEHWFTLEAFQLDGVHEVGRSGGRRGGNGHGVGGQEQRGGEAQHGGRTKRSGEAPHGGGRHAVLDPWTLIWDGAGPAAMARAVLDPGGHGFRRRADILVDPSIDVGLRVAQACRGLIRSPGGPAAPDPDEGATPAEDAAAAEDATAGEDAPPSRDPGLPVADRWGAVLDEDGWTWEARDGGSVAVRLRDEGPGLRAVMQPGTDHGWVITAEVVATPDLDSASRRALGVLLLTGAGLVRMVGGFATGRAGRERAGFAVHLPPDAAAPELTHGLSALSLAVARMGRAARALTDPGVAYRYLAIRGWNGVARREEAPPEAVEATAPPGGSHA